MQCIVGKARCRSRAFLDALPQISRALSNSVNSGSFKPNAPEAKPTHRVASLPSQLCKATTISLVAEEEDEQTVLDSVVDATNKGFVREDKCVRPHRTHSVDVAHRPTPTSARRLLEHSGSSNDRGRVLPKAACILRGFKEQEDKGLQRVLSNLSEASLSSKGNSSTEDIGAANQFRARNDVHMVAHANTSRQSTR